MARFNKGWVSVERRMFTNDIGHDPNLYAIWSTLIAWANIEESTAKLCGKPLRLKKGELVTSLDEMAKQWRISTNVVRRCLRYLKESNRIDMRSTNDGTFVKVLNYSKYQDRRKPNQAKTTREITSDGHAIDTPSSHDRQHIEQGNNGETKNHLTSVCIDGGDTHHFTIQSDFDLGEAWRAWAIAVKHPVSKKPVDYFAEEIAKARKEFNQSPNSLVLLMEEAIVNSFWKKKLPDPKELFRVCSDNLRVGDQIIKDAERKIKTARGRNVSA